MYHQTGMVLIKTYSMFHSGVMSTKKVKNKILQYMYLFPN